MSKNTHVWLVYKDGSSPEFPESIHWTKEGAVAEAILLTEADPYGRSFSADTVPTEVMP